MVEILETPIAARQAAGLRGSAKKSYEAFLDELESAGCQALGYRLTGPSPLPHLCVRHLWSRLRVVVAFESAERAWIVLIGEHIDAEPERDVYRMLYALAGTSPAPDERRTKPPCCGGEGAPPDLDDDVIDDLVDRARALVHRRTTTPHRPTRQ